MPARESRTELPSTQAEAIDRARSGAPSGWRIVAERQTAGRGRLDHAWASPPGGLYLSIVHRAPRAGRGLLPLGVGAAVTAALAHRYAVSPLLKWPNDLLVVHAGRVRKLAGILVDEVDSPTLGRAAVVGIGINVTTPPDAFDPALRARVVSLAELVTPVPTVAEVEEVVADAVDRAVAELDRPQGAEAVVAACRGVLYGRGHRASVDGSLRGVITALGDEGELWLSTASGPVAVRAGDLLVEES
ncbi:Biotin--acetyl-CoA-carboxylase ligase domain protein [mine drainage metagenome]|uniref:Biotin--acetyl-CoA-carboxylase ligase domain protein n=2 Tax=mine drainage metagenome TaxID=410659 RepID=T0ZFM1_9ZZZZ